MKKRKPILEQTILSPFLIHIWENIWSGISYHTPATLDEYLLVFETISRRFRVTIGDEFIKLLKPTDDTEEYLLDMESDLSWLLSTTNELKEECSYCYVLTRRQRRLLGRIQRKNEKIWERINMWLMYVVNCNDDLLEDLSTDYISEEIPYQKNFSVILKEYQKYSFQNN